MRRVALGFLAGLLGFVLLFGWGGGQDSDPQTCFGMFGWYTVPCGGWPAVAAGVVTGILVWLVLTWRERRR